MSTFSSTVIVSSRLKNWKTMPTCARRSVASWLSSRPTRLSARDHDLALVGPVETGDEVQQRRLAAPRRSHDRDELARPDVEIRAPQRPDRGQLRLERPVQRPCRDHIAGHRICLRRPVVGSGPFDPSRVSTRGPQIRSRTQGRPPVSRGCAPRSNPPDVRHRLSRPAAAPRSCRRGGGRARPVARRTMMRVQAPT